jgi:hypothetical protein
LACHEQQDADKNAQRREPRQTEGKHHRHHAGAQHHGQRCGQQDQPAFKELVIERGGGVRPHHLGTTQTRTHSGEAVAGAGRADAAQVATKNAQHPSAHQVGAPDQQRNSRQKIQQLFQRERSR